MTEQGKLLEKWTGYFEKLLNCDGPVEEFPRLNITTNDSVYSTSSKQEIAAQIKRLKNHKSPGEDGIQAEILKRVYSVPKENDHFGGPVFVGRCASPTNDP